MTSMNIASNAALGRPTFLRRALLYTFVLSIVLLPIRFYTIKYIILMTVMMMCADVLWRLIHRPRIPYTQVYLSIAILTLIYLTWFLLSLHYGNSFPYVVKDSIGFLIYLVFPVLFIYVVTNQLAATLGRAIIVSASVVVIIHVFAFAGYYLIFHTLTFEKLLAANFGIQSLGFTWELGATNGVLRANTKMGHIILMGIALLTYRFSQTKQNRYLLLIGVFIVGALLDGHKSLLVAIALFALFMSPLLVLNLERRPLQFLPPIAIGIVFVVVSFVMFVDTGAFFERFVDFGSGSFQVRKQQVDSLLAEIGNRPLIGNGFGASASVIRSDIRPFMYEVDFLAVAMKLGIVGGGAYFLTYFATISWPLLHSTSNYNLTVFSLGMAYLFYMGTNGGFAMSPISSLFHLLLFMCVSVCVMPLPNIARSSVRAFNRA